MIHVPHVVLANILIQSKQQQMQRVYSAHKIHSQTKVQETKMGVYVYQEQQDTMVGHVPHARQAHTKLNPGTLYVPTVMQGLTLRQYSHSLLVIVRNVQRIHSLHLRVVSSQIVPAMQGPLVQTEPRATYVLQGHTKQPRGTQTAPYVQ